MTELVGKWTASRLPGFGANLSTSYTLSLSYFQDTAKLIFSGREKRYVIETEVFLASFSPSVNLDTMWNIQREYYMDI